MNELRNATFNLISIISIYIDNEIYARQVFQIGFDFVDIDTIDISIVNIEILLITNYENKILRVANIEEFLSFLFWIFKVFVCVFKYTWISFFCRWFKSYCVSTSKWPIYSDSVRSALGIWSHYRCKYVVLVFVGCQLTWLFCLDSRRSSFSTSSCLWTEELGIDGELEPLEKEPKFPPVEDRELPQDLISPEPVCVNLRLPWWHIC